MFEEGFTRGIRCRFISKSVKVDSYVSGKDSLLTAIERNMPDLIVFDLNLYAKIDGVKISKEIRDLFKIPVMYKFIRLEIHPTTVWNWTL